MAFGDGATPLDVLGIGNAIVDVLSPTDDAILERHALPKGAMTLIDAERAEALYGRMGPGGRGVRRVVRQHDGRRRVARRPRRLHRHGARRRARPHLHPRHPRRRRRLRDARPRPTGPGTARCLILVTPDAHRTMSTYLGASVELGPEDVDADLVASAAVTYLEGYLWDTPRAKEAFRIAMAAAHGAGRRVSFTLSDSFCVERHRDEFRALVDDEVDVLFANQNEIVALYEVRDLDAAVAAVRGRCEIVVITRSEHGSMVVTADDAVRGAGRAGRARVVDTTGAGDLFAAGFLHGLTRGRPLAECAPLGRSPRPRSSRIYGARPRSGSRPWPRGRAPRRDGARW